MLTVKLTGINVENSVDKEKLREDIINVLENSQNVDLSKMTIRNLHEAQRKERANKEINLILTRGHRLLDYFANGPEINPAKVNPQLIRITNPSTEEGYLFRFASLLWSVPVSHGYGRRLRYLVMDKQNGKLIGLLALGDPVFNIRSRDQWIGWDVHQRKNRLAFVLDAYVLGAVPPYSLMLGSKLVGSMVASREIQKDFRSKYAGKKGIISQVNKNPYLVLVTTTSALGRSSVYNRLVLPGLVKYQRVGFTSGWGHFLIDNEMFRQVRLLLEEHGDPYHNNYAFGQGPSWRFRALRKASQILGIDADMLKHGIQRETYTIPLSTNWREILLAREKTPNGYHPTYNELGRAAVKRWVLPRATRTSDWLYWDRGKTWDNITEYIDNPSKLLQ